MRRFTFAFFFIVAAASHAQTPTLRAGYAIPTLPRYAPGQIISLFATGLKAPLNTVATTLPLPTTLEGVTVTAVETRTGGFSGDLPILGVTNSQFYGAISVEARDITAVTVQMPALSICLPDQFPNPCWYQPRIIATVKQNGAVLGASEFIQVPEDLRILNACDTITSPFLSADVKFTQMLANCYPVIAHADGKIATGDNPARPGETLVILTTGAGLWRTPLGWPAPGESPPYDRQAFRVSFDFRPDVFGDLIGGRSTDSIGGSALPEYAGSAPGMVGIDQINVRLPDTFPPETRRCAGLADTNVGILIAKGHTVTTARVCVLF
jgi:hypothetical protein